MGDIINFDAVLRQRDGETVCTNRELLEAAMLAGIRFADRPAFKKRLRESGEWSRKEMQDFSIVCSISLLDWVRRDLVRLLEFSNHQMLKEANRFWRR
jgi:hypothetical protein